MKEKFSISITNKDLPTGMCGEDLQNYYTDNRNCSMAKAVKRKFPEAYSVYVTTQDAMIRYRQGGPLYVFEAHRPYYYEDMIRQLERANNGKRTSFRMDFKLVHQVE